MGNDITKQMQMILYKTESEDISVSALLKDETIWLTQKAMAELFGVQKPAISKHLKNIFEQGEFNSYRVDSLSHSMKPIYESYDFAQKKTSVFLSHKHDDLNDLKGVSLCQVPKHWEYNIFQVAWVGKSPSHSQ